VKTTAAAVKGNQILGRQRDRRRVSIAETSRPQALLTEVYARWVQSLLRAAWAPAYHGAILPLGSSLPQSAHSDLGHRTRLLRSAVRLCDLPAAQPLR
jgi:hypothetical protein